MAPTGEGIQNIKVHDILRKCVVALYRTTPQSLMGFVMVAPTGKGNRSLKSSASFPRRCFHSQSPQGMWSSSVKTAPQFPGCSAAAILFEEGSSFKRCPCLPEGCASSKILRRSHAAFSEPPLPSSRLLLRSGLRRQEVVCESRTFVAIHEPCFLRHQKSQITTIFSPDPSPSLIQPHKCD